MSARKFGLPWVPMKITATQHARLINDLNALLATANDPYKNMLDNTLAILSLYVSTFVYSSHYQRVSFLIPTYAEKAHAETDHAFLH